MRTWNKTSFGNVSQKKEELFKKIQELDKEEASIGLSEELKSDRVKAKEEFQELVIGGNKMAPKIPIPG